MSHVKWFGLCFGVCLLGALTSVLLEKTHWLGIDAGTSWTLVCVLGWILAASYGVRAAWYPFSFTRITTASGLLAIAIVLVIGGGFLLQYLGLSLGWTAPDVGGLAWLAPLNQWLISFIWLGFWFVVARVLLRTYGAVGKRPHCELMGANGVKST